MASFASPTDLAAYLGATFDATTQAQAQAMLDQATAEMKDYMNQTIVQATETVTLDPCDRMTLVLPQFPVTAVSAVTVDGVALTLPGDIKWYSDGRLKRDNGNWSQSWGWKRQSVVVTYVHGYATIPDDLKAVCKARAARLMDNPTAVTTDSAGAVTTNYGTAPGEVFLPGEKAVMDNYGDLVSA